MKEPIERLPHGWCTSGRGESLDQDGDTESLSKLVPTGRDETDNPIVTIGEPLVEFIPITPVKPTAGELLYELSCGGAPVNYAVALSKWGKKAALIARVGTDRLSRFLLEAVEAEGVDTQKVNVVSDRQIGLVIHPYLHSESGLLFYRNESAGSGLSPEDIDPALIAKAALVHFPGMTLQISESAKNAALLAARVAKENGVPVSFDPNMRVILGGIGARKAMEEAVELADLLTPTLEEAAAITNETDVMRAGQKLLNRGTKLVAVTMGEEGCALFRDELVVSCPGHKVPVVEPTGAGDIFAAALTLGFLEEWELDEIARFANAAGAFAVTQRGHLGKALPTLEAIQKLMKEGER